VRLVDDGAMARTRNIAAWRSAPEDGSAGEGRSSDRETVVDVARLQQMKTGALLRTAASPAQSSARPRKRNIRRSTIRRGARRSVPRSPERTICRRRGRRRSPRQAGRRGLGSSARQPCHPAGIDGAKQRVRRPARPRRFRRSRSSAPNARVLRERALSRRSKE